MNAHLYREAQRCIVHDFVWNGEEDNEHEAFSVATTKYFCFHLNLY